MDTSTSALLTSVLVVSGQWANGKGITTRVVLGGIFLAIVLSVMSNANEKLAKQFGLLILVGAVITYVPTILTKTGIGKPEAKKK